MAVFQKSIKHLLLQLKSNFGIYFSFFSRPKIKFRQANNSINNSRRCLLIVSKLLNYQLRLTWVRKSTVYDSLFQLSFQCIAFTYRVKKWTSSICSTILKISTRVIRMKHKLTRTRFCIAQRSWRKSCFRNGIHYSTALRWPTESWKSSFIDSYQVSSIRQRLFSV